MFLKGGVVMSELIFYTGYIFFSIAFYIPSLLASQCWSGRKFSTSKFIGVIVYNIFCVYVHMRFVDRGVLPIVGEKNNEILGWASFVMMFMYMFSVPMPWEGKKLKVISKYFKT